MDIKLLTAETKKLTVEYKTAEQPFPVEIEYRPNAITLGYFNRLEGKEPTERIISQLQEVIVRWDLTDGGKEVKIEREAITTAQVPLDLLNTILSSVWEDIRADRDLKKE